MANYSYIGDDYSLDNTIDSKDRARFAPPADDGCTPEMTQRLIQNLIDEGHLVAR